MKTRTSSKSTRVTRRNVDSGDDGTRSTPTRVTTRATIGDTRGTTVGTTVGSRTRSRSRSTGTVTTTTTTTTRPSPTTRSRSRSSTTKPTQKSLKPSNSLKFKLNENILNHENTDEDDEDNEDEDLDLDGCIANAANANNSSSDESSNNSGSDVENDSANNENHFSKSTTPKLATGREIYSAKRSKSTLKKRLAGVRTDQSLRGSNGSTPLHNALLRIQSPRSATSIGNTPLRNALLNNSNTPRGSLRDSLLDPLCNSPLGTTSNSPIGSIRNAPLDETPAHIKIMKSIAQENPYSASNMYTPPLMVRTSQTQLSSQPLLDTFKKKRVNKAMAARINDDQESGSDADGDGSSSNGEDVDFDLGDDDSQEGIVVDEYDDEDNFPFRNSLSSRKTPLNASTSNATLKLIDLPPSEYSALLALHASQSDPHVNHRARLLDLHKQAFDQWAFEAECGSSLLFYGFGSKYDLIGLFVREMFDTVPIISINGFYPTLNFRQILSKIVKRVVGHEGALGTMSNQVRIIKDFMESPTCPFPYIVLIFHNLDGPRLISESIQTIIATLASSARIRVVASIDDINAPNLWPLPLLTLFNFSWHDVTTYAAYMRETSFETALVGSGGTQGSRVAVSMRHVLGSVNPHAKKLFLILAKHQVGSGAGMEKKVLYTRAKNAFVASEYNLFLALLTEFLDHGMVGAVHEDGEDVLRIPMDKDSLAGIVEEIEAAGVRV